MVVADEEAFTCGERLELLAVVRGLEALDGPSRVTLVTKSRYVSRGLRFGMAEWRANDWNWERFGRVVPVKDSDLWQRVDRALLYHEVECQAWQFEAAATAEESIPNCKSSTSEVQVEAVDSRCSGSMPNSCEVTESDGQSLKQENRLAPTKRRLAAEPRVRRRRISRPTGQHSYRGSLAAVLADQATSLRETLRDLVGSSRELAPGTA